MPDPTQASPTSSPADALLPPIDRNPAAPVAAGEAPRPGEQAAPGTPRRGRILGMAALVLGIIALVLFGRQLAEPVRAFAAFVAGLGPWAGVAFLGGYALATVLFAPGWILTLAGGAIFGLGWGTLYVFLGATLGSTLAFLLARHGLRGWVERQLADNPRFAAIDRAVAREGRKVVFLLRLAPAFPFNLLNYALGLTRVRFVDYLLASLGMLPGTFLYVYYGRALGSVAALASGAQVEKGAEQWVFFGLGLVATVVVTVIVTRLARRALAEVAR